MLGQSFGKWELLPEPVSFLRAPIRIKVFKVFLPVTDLIPQIFFKKKVIILPGMEVNWSKIVMWEHCTTMQTGTVSGLWLCRRSWRLNVDLRRDSCAHLEVTRLFPYVGYATVSHSSTESEVISLDAGLTHGWNPSSWSMGFGYWSVSFFTQSFFSKIERLHGNVLRDTPSNKHTQNQTKTPMQHDSLELSHADFVSSNVKSSQLGAMLHIFEDNEAEIKNDHERQKSNIWDMCHRTHIELLLIGCLTRLTWVRYIDTKPQLADIDRR